MSRMRCWQFWLPRVMFVVIVMLAVQYGLGIIARSTAIDLAEGFFGSHVDVSHARVSILGQEVVLSGLKVSDPRRPLQNLVEADGCWFDLSASPLLHKRVVIDRGAVSGLRFATPRNDGSAMVEVEPVDAAYSIQWWNEETNRQAGDWLEHLNRRFDPQLIGKFKAIKRTSDLGDRILRETASLDERAKVLGERAEELQTKMNQALANPLRHAEFLRTVAEDVPAVQRDFAQLAEDMERLPGLIDAGRSEIVAARRQDEIWLRTELQMPPVDTNALTDYLLRKHITTPLDELVGWLRFTRQMVPAEPTQKSAKGQRGEDILFSGCERLPGLLVHELALSGRVHVGGRPIDLHGTLRDFASVPSSHDKPLRVKLASKGATSLVFQATVDRTGEVARDELLIDSTGVVLPPAELGESDRLRLALAPSVGALSISVSLEGEQLAGDIQLVQKQVRITPCIGGDLSDVPMTGPLDDALGDVGALATHISLSGTLVEPKCRLWSNLGPAVAEALDRALSRAAELHARQLITAAERTVDQRITELERHVSDTQAELRPQLARASGQLGEIAACQRPPQRITTEHVGRRLPANSLFR